MANISKKSVVTAIGTANVNQNLLSRFIAPGSAAPTSTTEQARTKYYGDYGIIIPATTSSDTYFSIYFKQALTQNTVYTLSCYTSGLISGTYYNFPLFAQSNSSMGLLPITKNGLCYVTFTMTYTGTQASTSSPDGTVYKCLMDDITRNIASGQGPITLTNFKLEEGSVPTPWIPCSIDPKYEGESSSLFEFPDICRIRKNGNIQASEFIEF